MDECKYCRQVRDDNEDLIYSETNEECNYFTVIRYKQCEFRLYTVNSFIRIKYCPICGRELKAGGKND